MDADVVARGPIALIGIPSAVRGRLSVARVRTGRVSMLRGRILPRQRGHVHRGIDGVSKTGRENSLLRITGVGSVSGGIRGASLGVRSAGGIRGAGGVWGASWWIGRLVGPSVGARRLHLRDNRSC